MQPDNKLLVSRLLLLPRNAKRLIMVLADAILLPLALVSAIMLRHYPYVPDLSAMKWIFFVLPLVTIPVFVRLGLYRAVIRYMEDKVVIIVLAGVTISTMLLITMSLFAGYVPTLSRAAYVLFWVLALLYVGGSRMVIRGYLRRHGGGSKGEPVAVYGAGRAGVQLVHALRMGHEFRPVAIFDDTIDLHGAEVAGLSVHPLADIAEVVEDFGVRQVLLAIPSASRKHRKEIIGSLERLHLQIKTIPSPSEIALGQARIDEVRQVSIEDLLGREPVAPNEALLAACVRDKVVMVTGAGGSIGSELCRQVLQLKPIRLVLFEISEYALYSIEQELRRMAGVQIEIIAILGSVTHRRRLEAVMRVFGVQTVYHAAAYKHVPLVEHNVIEGVRNNVFGTWDASLAAAAANVETFILISTDKAVRPTNVMGASKRLAELVLQAMAQRRGGPRYCMVRFGNVLGSSGSVVPLFEHQIRHGGPVTVTHPEIIRYFMTIPEAAQLVIQAGSMGKGGEVFVLDMGQPVKILSLAKRMIHLSGFTVRDATNPEGDIEIVFTGLRPGEKLYEELLIGGDVTGTQHPLIMQATERSIPLSELETSLQVLDDACHAFDCGAVRELLQKLVEGYSPQGGIEDHLWNVAGSCEVATQIIGEQQLH